MIVPAHAHPTGQEKGLLCSLLRPHLVLTCEMFMHPHTCTTMYIHVYNYAYMYTRNIWHIATYYKHVSTQTQPIHAILCSQCIIYT